METEYGHCLAELIGGKWDGDTVKLRPDVEDYYPGAVPVGEVPSLYRFTGRYKNGDSVIKLFQIVPVSKTAT